MKRYGTLAAAALLLLGYSSAEVNPFLQGKDWTGVGTDQIIKEVLKNMV